MIIALKGTLMVDMEDWNGWKTNNSVSLSCRRSSAFWVCGVTPRYGLVYVTPKQKEALQSLALTLLVCRGKVFYTLWEIKGIDRCLEYPSNYEYSCPIRVQYDHFASSPKIVLSTSCHLDMLCYLVNSHKSCGHRQLSKTLTADCMSIQFCTIGAPIGIYLCD